MMEDARSSFCVWRDGKLIRLTVGELRRAMEALGPMDADEALATATCEKIRASELAPVPEADAARILERAKKAALEAVWAMNLEDGARGAAVGLAAEAYARAEVREALLAGIRTQFKYSGEMRSILGFLAEEYGVPDMAALAPEAMEAFAARLALQPQIIDRLVEALPLGKLARLWSVLGDDCTATDAGTSADEGEAAADPKDGWPGR